MTDLLEKVQFSVLIKKLDRKKKIVFGEVYAPNIIDSHGDMMEEEDVELLAHRFLGLMKQDKIDIMHNNKPANAVAVESFIARGHLDYNEGAWVVATKILDADFWDDIESGKYNGYSMEAMVKKIPALVELELTRMVFGATEDNDGHNHYYYVEINDDGKVIGGVTSVDDGHSHKILYGTATEETDEHQHRYFLP